MPDIISSPLFWMLCVLGVTMTGISKSGFAGGAGVVAVPLLALVMPVPEAVFLMLPLLLVMDAKTIQYYYRHMVRSELKIIIPSALLGIALGGFVLGTLDPFYLQLGLGVLSLVFALWHKLAPLMGGVKGAGFLWGGLSGLTSTLIHAGGPPINIYLIALKLPKDQWLATAAVFFGVMNLTKIIPYSLSGGWSLSLVILSGFLVPIALLGTWLGKRIQAVISEKAFMQICRAMLLVSGTMLIAKSLL